MNPRRYTVIHFDNGSGGNDRFTVAQGSRATNRAIVQGTNQGYRVVSKSARFDFTLAQWGLSPTSTLQASDKAATALRNVKPTTPRKPKAAGTNGAPKFAAAAKAGAPIFPPKPDARNLRITALAALEDAFKWTIAERGGATPDIRKSFETYQKVKAIALGSAASGPTSTPESQNEAASALRRATLTLVQLTY